MVELAEELPKEVPLGPSRSILVAVDGSDMAH